MVWFLGDVHSKFSHVTDALAATVRKPAAVVFMGDVQARDRQLDEFIVAVESSGTKVYWIIGNHDTDTEQDFRPLLSPLVRERCIDGRVIEIGDVKVAGLGGIFRGSVWYPKTEDAEPARFRSFDEYAKHLRDQRGVKRRLSKLDRIRELAVPGEFFADVSKDGQLRQAMSTIFPDVYERLAKQRADILVTHEGPGAHPYGFVAIDELAIAMGVQHHFHGHLHDNLPYSPMANGCQSYGVGLRGITSLNCFSGSVSVVLPGEEDATRLHRHQLKKGVAVVSPTLIKDLRKSHPAIELAINCGNGWVSLCTQMLDAISRELNGKSASVKLYEKCGTLRAIIEPLDDWDIRFERLAAVKNCFEKKSESVCESCGDEGRLIDSPDFIRVRCCACESDT